MSTAVKRRNAAENNGKSKPVEDELSDSSASSPPPSSNPSYTDLKGLDGYKRKSLKEKAKIHPCIYVSYFLILSLEYVSGLTPFDMANRWYESMRNSWDTTIGILNYSKDLSKATLEGDYREPSEYLKTGIIGLAILSIGYVFFIAPLRAGLWTGERAKKHVIHRYLGLAFLIQYAFAWIEYLTNYEFATTSVLPHAIALNGIIQGSSAFFSFKVLPELSDPGYYSDKAVLSRRFVLENMFFTLMGAYGSSYYNDEVRKSMQSSIYGRIIECVFLVWPYIVVRPWFPITRFQNAGTTHNGRTVANQRFYEYGTLAVKFFYLWAKYFLGFYVNFMIYLDIATPENWKMMRGMLLLNIGTVSLAVFLHTLRFKKVLPPKLTFSVYLLQIYATFSAIPIAYDMFASHLKLCGVVFVGLLANMTRSRKVHAVWCLAVMVLFTQKEIDW